MLLNFMEIDMIYCTQEVIEFYEDKVSEFLGCSFDTDNPGWGEHVYQVLEQRPKGFVDIEAYLIEEAKEIAEVIREEMEREDE